MYGKRIIKPAKILVEIIIQAFKQLGIEYTVKSNICFTKINSTASNAFTAQSHRRGKEAQSKRTRKLIRSKSSQRNR